MAVSPEISGEIRSAGESSLKKTGHGCLMTCAADAVLTALWCWMILGRFGFWYTTTMATPFLFCALMVFLFSNKYLLENVRLHTDPEIFKGDKM